LCLLLGRRAGEAQKVHTTSVVSQRPNIFGDSHIRHITLRKTKQDIRQMQSTVFKDKYQKFDFIKTTFGLTFKCRFLLVKMRKMMKRPNLLLPPEISSPSPLFQFVNVFCKSLSM
jgi:hypothetical protein